jgi:signal transduction histidine kinase
MSRGLALTRRKTTSDVSREQPDGRLLASLATLGAELAAVAEPAELQQAVLQRVAALLDCQCGALALWDESEQVLKPGAVIGEGHMLQTLDFFASRPVTESLLARNEGLCLADPEETLGLSFGNLTAVVAVPMMTGGRLIGILVLASTVPGRRLAPADQAALQVVANFSAALVDSAIQFKRFSYDLRARIIEATRELSRATGELAQVKAFNENIFESIPMGVVVFDRSLAVIFRNREAERIFPDDRNVLHGLARTDIAARYADYQSIFRDVVRLGQSCTFDAATQDQPAAGPRVLRLVASPLVGKRDSTVGGILAIEDVSRDVSMESRLAASERLAAVGKLAAKVAHELNNPLDGILRYLGLAVRVLKDSPDQRPVGYVEAARGGLMRMARIISELLEFSRSTVVSCSDGSLRAALQDAIASLSGKAQDQQVALELEIADAVPTMESSSLYQVFTNLIKNAIEAQPRGGRVQVRAVAIDGAVDISVADDGPGLSREALAHLFEPFFSTKDAGQGTGLGLAICKELVEKQGGTLLARNRPAGGAEFVVRIATLWASKDAGSSPVS